jgi:hypothetical protein
MSNCGYKAYDRPLPTQYGGNSRAGEKNPNFGKVSTNALSIKIYDCKDNKFTTFDSHIGLKKALGIDYKTITNLSDKIK